MGISWHIEPKGKGLLLLPFPLYYLQKSFSTNTEYMELVSIGTFVRENRENHSIQSGDFIELIGITPLGKLSFA